MKNPFTKDDLKYFGITLLLIIIVQAIFVTGFHLHLGLIANMVIGGLCGFAAGRYRGKHKLA